MRGKLHKFTLPMAVFAAILAISTASILIRYAQAAGVPSIVIAAMRLIFATLFLAPMTIVRYSSEIKRIPLRILGLGAAAGIFLAIHFATWITSLEFTSVASSAIFVSTGPFWVALLSPFLLKEKLSGPAILGLCLSLGGGILIGVTETCTWNERIVCEDLGNILQGRTMWGNLLALAGAWAITGYLIIGRKLRAGISLVPYIFLVYGMAAVVLIIIMIVNRKTPFGYAPEAYLWLILLAVLPQLVGHSTLNWTLKYLPAALVAVTTLAEPVGSAILAYFLLNESPTLPVFIGGVFILSGIYFISWDQK